MNSILGLLEVEREKLGETQETFAKRIDLPGSVYTSVKVGKNGFPKRCLSKISELLNKSEAELRLLPHFIPFSEQEWSAEELLYLAGIADAAGRALPLQLLAEHLQIKNTSSK